MTLLKHVAEVRVSNVDKKTAHGDTQIRLCNYTDVYYNGVVRADAGGYMSATATPEQRRVFALRAGDTVLTKDSETAEDIGVSTYIEQSDGDFVCGYHLAIARPKATKVDPRYLRWSIASTFVRGQLAAAATGVTRMGLRSEAIANLELPDVPITDQGRIADYLDAECTRLDRLIELRQIQRKTMSSALLEKLRMATTGVDQATTSPSGVEWMPRVAAGWSVPRISWVFATGSGTTPASDNSAYYDGEIPWVNTGDLSDSVLGHTTRTVTDEALRQFSALKLFPARSLVVAMYGQGATKGRVGLLGMQACVNQACCVLTSRGGALTEWAAYWFRGHKSEIVELAVGSGQPNLNQELVRSLRLPLPPVSEQERRIAAMRELDVATSAAVRRMDLSIDLLRERKQALITAAVTGAFDVPAASGSGA